MKKMIATDSRSLQRVCLLLFSAICISVKVLRATQEARRLIDDWSTAVIRVVSIRVGLSDAGPSGRH